MYKKLMFIPKKLSLMSYHPSICNLSLRGAAAEAGKKRSKS